MKILRYWWFFALIAVAAYLLLFRVGNGTISSSEREFAIADTAAITRITISGSSEGVVLERRGNQWLANGASAVSPKVMATFLMAASRIEAGAPLTSSVADSILPKVKTEGVDVKFFSGRRMVRGYKVLSTSFGGNEAIGLANNASNCFRLKVTGSKGNAADFFVANSNFWQSNVLLPTNHEPVESVTVEIPSNQSLSFQVTSKPNIALRNLNTNRSVEAFDTLAVKRFLKALADVSIEKHDFEASSEAVSAVKRLAPMHVFAIQTVTGRVVRMQTYPIPVKEYRDEFGRSVKYDLNRLYVSIPPDSTRYIVRYVALDPVLKDLSSFISK